MNITLNRLKIYRYICIIVPIAGTLIISPVAVYPAFILISLLVFINSQIRMTVLKNRMFLASLLMEILLVVYLNSLTSGYIYFILFSTLLDTVINLRDEAYIVSILTGAALLYALYPLYSLEWVLVILFFYAVVFILLLQLAQELNARMDTELLYDRIRKSNYELEAARARLLSYSKQVEKVSQLKERNRISRELHDSLGHNLTGVLMQVDAAIQIIPLDQEKGLEILTAAYKNINISIEGVRQTVRKLSPAAFQPCMVSLRELVENL